MNFIFKQSVRLNRKTYPCGVHFVSEEVQELAFFKRLLKSGMLHRADFELPKEKLEMDLSKLPPQTRKLAEKVLEKEKKAASPEAEPEDDKKKKRK